jgi:hypothetical protein
LVSIPDPKAIDGLDSPKKQMPINSSAPIKKLMIKAGNRLSFTKMKELCKKNQINLNQSFSDEENENDDDEFNNR